MQYDSTNKFQKHSELSNMLFVIHTYVISYEEKRNKQNFSRDGEGIWNGYKEVTK